MDIVKKLREEAQLLIAAALEIERLRRAVYLGKSPDEKRSGFTPVSEFGWSVRARNVLSHHAISSMEELARLSENDILRHRNAGSTTLNEIKSNLALADMELRLQSASSEEQQA